MSSNIFWIAFGLALAMEGLTYALVPGQMQKIMARMQQASPDQLRMAGTVVLALGVFVIWMSSGAQPT